MVGVAAQAHLGADVHNYKMQRQQVHRLCQRTQGSTEEGERLNDGERRINPKSFPQYCEDKKKGKKKKELAGKRNDCHLIL
ncbi:uncharacterized [Tachysurus ichikawai]